MSRMDSLMVMALSTTFQYLACLQFWGTQMDTVMIPDHQKWAALSRGGAS